MSGLTLIDSQTLVRLLPWQGLVGALQNIFVSPVVEPVRHHHAVSVPDDPDATLLLMPAWIEGQYLGVKQVAVFPGNSNRGMAGLHGQYLLSSAKTGEPLIQIDANELTARRTAAASALASQFLSRDNSRRLLIMGAGRLARALVAAHCAVRPIERIDVWSRTEASAQTLVDELRAKGVEAAYCPTSEISAVTRNADIISCATLSTEPIIRGDDLSAGVHLDLVGAFRPDMRETDDRAMQRASVFVDTRAGALSEAGDLVQAIASGAFSESQVEAAFSELCAGTHSGRAQLLNPDEQITLFKSVGAAREDLAAAIMAYEAWRDEQ